MSLKVIDKNIKSVATNASKLNLLIHNTGILILEHAKEHGDCTRALSLVKAMPASMRKTMLVLWFSTYSPIRVMEKNDKVGMLKDTAKGYTPFDIEAARETAFFDLAEQNPEKTYDFKALVALVERLGKTIEKKIEDGKVPEEDKASAEAIAAQIKSLNFKRVVAEQPAPAVEQDNAPVEEQDNAVEDDLQLRAVG